MVIQHIKYFTKKKKKCQTLIKIRLNKETKMNMIQIKYYSKYMYVILIYQHAEYKLKYFYLL